jgi:hypothetical protein
MGQSNCGRVAAASTMFLLGLSPALAMDRVAPDRVAPDRAQDRVAPDRLAPDPVAPDPGAPDSALDVGRAAGAGPCPTRFDYLVLASFADAPGLLSLSTYRFRSKVGFSTIPLGGLIRVDYRVESRAGDCRYHGMSRRPSG